MPQGRPQARPAAGRKDSVLNPLLEKLLSAELVSPGYHSTFHGGSPGVRHRHRYTKAQWASRRRWRAIDSVNDFTRTRMMSRGFYRHILPPVWSPSRPLKLSRAGPNGATFVLRLEDQKQPDQERFGSYLKEDIVWILKSGTVAEDGPDLVISTYSRYWVDRVVSFLNGRGYALTEEK